MRSSRVIACLAIAVLVATTAQATPITVYNTGVDGGGAALADNAVDSHWTLSGTGAADTQGPDAIVATSAGGFPIGPWMGDSATSAWITPAEDTNGPGATDGTANYLYTTTFTTPGDGQVAFSGQQSADNGVVAFDVDGIAGTYTPVGFNAWASFDILVDVTGTDHTLTFTVHNGTGEANPDGPAGFRAEFNRADYVPEPGALALLAIGGLALLRRRR